MKAYTKPALTYARQITLLKSRGLNIADEKRTERHLQNVNYYRLSAYMIPYKQKDSAGVIQDKFINGSSWDDIYNLYKFDRKLRLLILDAIERIEIALRAQLIYQLSHKYGSHWQDNPAIFKVVPLKSGHTLDAFTDIQKHISEQRNAHHRELFVDHYMKNYNTPVNPPCWMSIELLYISELSRICQCLNSKSDLTDIAAYFQIHNADVFCSWLHSINYIRNICAHHARLWNIPLAIQPSKYKKPKSGLKWLSTAEIKTAQSSKLYYFMCVLLYLLQVVNPKTKFCRHFKDLLAEYPKVDVGLMGFPSDWDSQPLWNL